VPFVVREKRHLGKVNIVLQSSAVGLGYNRKIAREKTNKILVPLENFRLEKIFN
jgi:hypothetical protein